MTLVTAQLAWGDCEDPVKYQWQIDAFLCCAEEIPIPRNKLGHHLLLRDGEPIDDQSLDPAFRFLDEQLQAKRLVLVYCASGRARSVSVITGYLALRNFKAPHVILRPNSETAIGSLPVGTDIQISDSIRASTGNRKLKTAQVAISSTRDRSR
jgi:rhodanese-related sulfurtransferase